MIIMNIVLLLNNDIASNLALNLLLPALQLHNIKVFLSSKVGGNSTRPQALQELAQFEQHEVYLTLEQVQASTELSVNFKTYADIAQQYAIEIETLNQINSVAGLAKIQAFSADLIISIRYGVILKPPVIALSTHGVINLHSGLLPNYRGVMATFWALLNGDKQLATSLHFIDDSTIDTGGIIANSTLSAQQDKSYLWHVLSLYIGGCQLIEQAIKALEQGDELTTLVQAGQGHYFTFPSTEQIMAFTRCFGALYEPIEIVDLLSVITEK
ncbi:MAG: methionyl-tRNA formyltransferase [Cognaticolwellia sp.]|jgi:methionyl-tRNA formyltransferase